MDIFPTFLQMFSRFVTGALRTIFVVLGIYAAFLLVTWSWLLGIVIALPLLAILGVVLVFWKDFWLHWFGLAILGLPSLVIDERGIFDNSKPVGLGLIPWQFIEYIAFDEQEGQVELYLQEESLADWRLYWPLRLSYDMCMYAAQAHHPLALSMAYIGCGPDELLRIMREHKTTVG